MRFRGFPSTRENYIPGEVRVRGVGGSVLRRGIYRVRAVFGVLRVGLFVEFEWRAQE